MKKLDVMTSSDRLEDNGEKIHKKQTVFVDVKRFFNAASGVAAAAPRVWPI